MLAEPIRFSYGSDGTPEQGSLPLLPIRLQIGSIQLDVKGLVDSGSSVNVLPYQMGIQLGATWENQGQDLILGGNLASAPARGLLVDATVGSFPQVRLAFAWSRLTNVPIILGQMNFFQSFNISFIGAEQTFEIYPYSDSSK